MALNLRLLTFCVLCLYVIEAADEALIKCTQHNGDKGYCVTSKKCCETPLQQEKHNECTEGVCCNVETLKFKKIKEQCNKVYEELIIPPDAFIGGLDSLAAEFPHMAALGYNRENEAVWGCGGSLISETYVLTAAHCISNGALGEVLIVRVGDLNLRSSKDDALPQDLKVKRRIPHPKYTASSKYNDIALIELEEPVRITFYSTPACIGLENEVRDKNWIATGWGDLGFRGQSADHLQKGELREYKFEECSTYYNVTNRRLSEGIDDATQICAGYKGRDTCQGDSGGPLQIQNYWYYEGFKSIIIGVTSFGKACGLSTAPGVYTRVSAYAEWIESIVWPED